MRNTAYRPQMNKPVSPDAQQQVNPRHAETRRFRRTQPASPNPAAPTANTVAGSGTGWNVSTTLLPEVCTPKFHWVWSKLPKSLTEKLAALNPPPEMLPVAASTVYVRVLNSPMSVRNTATSATLSPLRSSRTSAPVVMVVVPPVTFTRLMSAVPVPNSFTLYRESFAIVSPFVMVRFGSAVFASASMAPPAVFRFTLPVTVPAPRSVPLRCS